MANYRALIFHFVLFVLSINVLEINSSNVRHIREMRKVLRKNLRSYFDFYEKEKEFFPTQVETLMRCFNACFTSEDVPLPSGKRYPFIVVEGNNRTTRKAVARILVKKMDAGYVFNPPVCLVKLTNLFPQKTLARYIFYILSTYVSAYIARQFLAEGMPVVLSGYYYEQTSFTMIRECRTMYDLPPEGDELYNLPTDLMKPDIVFYINYNLESKFNDFDPHTSARKGLEVFKNIREVPTRIINAEEKNGYTVAKLYEKLIIDIGDKFLFNEPVNDE